MTLTILQTNDYLIRPEYSSATVSIADSSTTVSVFPDPDSGDAIKPGGPPGDPAVIGRFQFSRNDSRSGTLPEMAAYYTVSGTSSNGEDYTLLSGMLDFADGEADAFLDVNPPADTVYDGIQTITVTLIPTNSYVVSASHSNATINIDDSSTTVSIFKVQDAIETNSALGVGQVGIFNVHREDARGDRPQMTVNYSISGTASNGVDYTTLSGTVTFAAGASDTNIFVQTLPDDLLEGDETVTLTIMGNGNEYLISDSASNATLIIHDTIVYSTVTTLTDVIGIDYYEPSNSLIASFNYSGGSPNFTQVFTNIVVSNGVPITNVLIADWSEIGGLQDEVYLTTVKTGGLLTNSAGFTNGDMFFGSGSGIGWLSANTTRSNLDWCILTNSAVTNALLLRGGICMDQTGTFSNQLVAVTSPSGVDFGPKGIWRVDSHAHPTLLTNIFTEHLEGVTTLTNDATKWGPWAGKIITGDESHSDPVTGAADPVIYTIDINGIVATNHTMALVSGGIFPEDFDVIPANQNLYFTAFNNFAVMELPSHYFTNYIGDLLVSQAGEGESAGLFIVHWNAQNSNFVTLSIPVPDSIGGKIEGATFAPIQFPGQ